uniref:uncharacterized protein C19orf44 homolog isoform X2 n=1 Tax=Jaculus jaculus TaxID=51337 RepID=UPI001E1B15A6|nr:uncharacterized protein C19orf44 homolog isoform X2 [Jaculus jaculus]
MASTRKSSHPTHNIFDFSDIFLEDSKIQEIRNLQVRSHAQGVPDQSRFLKRNQTMDNKYLTSKVDCVPARLSSCGAPTTTSKIRASAALMKLAQIETKIKNRKKACTTLSDTESDSQTMDENLLEGTNRIAVHSTAVCSSQHTHRTFLKQAREIPITKSNMASGKVSRFLKKKEPPVENASPDTHIEKVNNVQTPRQKEPARKFDFDFPDSDEEEMKELLGSLLESSREKEKFMNQELVSTKDEIPTQPRVLSVLSVELSSSEPSQRTLCLLASQTAPRTRHSTRSRACSPQDTVSCASSLYISDNFSKSVSSKMGCIRLASSQSKNEVGPSGEPVSEVADDSLDDFRVNVLSLDDLVPAITEKDMEQKEEDAGRKGLSGKSFPAKSPARLEAQKPSPPRNSAFQGKSTSLVGDKSLTTPSEVSEHLSASSASASQPHSVSSMDSAEVPMMHTAIPTYSEDFKHSLTPMTSESTTSSFESLDRTLDALSQFSLKTDLLKPSLSRTKRGQDITRIIMKETAVQTLDPTFAYQWSTALTAYSPAMLALNDMLKQQLSLTQQSIEATRHLHISLLQSLDRDAFHYHTLEEAKEYIKCHRPAPLTMEAALQEVKEEL